MSLLPPSLFPKSLKDLDQEELIQWLYLVEHPVLPSTTDTKHPSLAPLDCMEQEEILTLLHYPKTSPPAIRPCDMPNALNTKSHWMAEELHRITGCHSFQNYKHLISTKKVGSFIDNGKFPMQIGAFTTIPKAPCSKANDRTKLKFLDIVHLNIAFGDCMSVNGFRYALIFVDRATHFNWCFGLKSLHHDGIITAFLAFHSEAGSLAHQFQCDCDEKLFGSHFHLFFHLNRSSIASSPASRQSTNGLVESHWKIMVHMLRTYLTEKEMPCSFWYYTIKHSAQMMNMIPGHYSGKLTSPSMLIHGVRPVQRIWLPLFSICYSHHEKDTTSNISRTKPTQWMVSLSTISHVQCHHGLKPPESRLL